MVRVAGGTLTAQLLWQRSNPTNPLARSTRAPSKLRPCPTTLLLPLMGHYTVPRWRISAKLLQNIFIFESPALQFSLTLNQNDEWFSSIVPGLVLLATTDLVAVTKRCQGNVAFRQLHNSIHIIVCQLLNRKEPNRIQKLSFYRHCLGQFSYLQIVLSSFLNL